MSRKLDSARIRNDLDDNLPKGRGDCFDYGSDDGCDGECPVLEAGDCEIAVEDFDAFASIFKDYPEIAEMYKKGGE